MSFHSACLQDFILRIPICSHTATVAEIVQQLAQSGSDRVILLDPQARAVGLMQLKRLLPQLLSSPPATDLDQASIPVSRLEPTLLEPIVTLAATQTVADWLPHMADAQTWAIVDTNGCYLGLLDQARLQQYLLQQAHQQLAQWLPSAPPPPTHLVPFHIMLGLLDTLPLPLMLQTGRGTALAQNRVWQQHLGELLAPDVIRQEASVILAQSEERLSVQAHSSSPGQPLAPNLPDPGRPEPDTYGSCQISRQPNTCICTCALKNGQEVILQFAKIPLGYLLPNWQVDLSSSQLPHPATASPPAPFHLAHLVEQHTLSADPPRSSDSLWLVLAQDITEQQHLAQELTVKNADLVQLNRLKDEFLACVTHELKTPLTAVLGLSTLLKDQTLGELNPRQIHYAQLIYQSGRHLMTVVNDILDLTRIETGQVDLNLCLVNIPTVCSRAFEQTQQAWLLESKRDAMAEPRAIAQFSLEIDPGIDSMVADELRLRQMLGHLLSNAVKFTDPTDHIGLRVSHWGGWIAFTVWDQGIGIPSDKQHLIFQKFQQLENPLTRQFEGAGLGLALTQRLARLHGGDVTFLSQEGQGSQFTILLPPTPPTPPRLAKGHPDLEDSPTLKYPGGRVSLFSPTPAKPGPDLPWATSSLRALALRNRLVLIVDAVAASIEPLWNQLVGLGYRVVIARSGTEALEKARRLQPCVIFLNPLLPLLSGWDVLTLLKANWETRTIPIVITATKVDEEAAQRSQADTFLQQPVQAKALQTVMHQLAKGQEEPELPERATAADRLTILRLHPTSPHSPLESGTPVLAELDALLHTHHYRILEAEDLEQADLVARVWQPDVILLEGPLPEPAVFLAQLRHHTSLVALPLVTLDASTTQAANQVPELLVFPCLAPTPIGGYWESSTLLKVIQVAAGYVCRPVILAVDSLVLARFLGACATQESCLGGLVQETEWLRALVQYLQTAGMDSQVGNSWPEVMQQLQARSVDLLLIDWTAWDYTEALNQAFQELQQLEDGPPVLVLDHRYPQPPDAWIALPDPIKQLATEVLPSNISMSDLLQTIHQTLQAPAKGAKAT